MKTRKEVMFLLLVIILLGIGCIFFFSQKREEQKSQTSMKEEIAAAGIPVTSYVVERAYWDYWKTYYGKIKAASEQSITAYVREFVSSVHVDVGDMVIPGDILCELEKVTQTSVLTSQQTEFENARRDLERKKHLYQAGGISKQEVEQAVALLNERKARLQEARTVFQRTAIRSSTKGVVLSKNIHVGEIAEPGMELFRLASLEDLELEVMIASSDALHIDVGVPCRVLYSETVTRGVIKRIDPEAQAETGMYKGVISLERTLNLYPGTFVEVQIRMDSRRNAIVIPDDLLRRERNEAYVFVIIEDKAFRRKINPGKSQDGLLEVRGELDEGEVLVREGVDRVYDGATVVVIQKGQNP